MKRYLPTALALTIVAGAAAAAVSLGAPQSDVIDIRVAPNDLAECRKTLAQVTDLSAVADSDTPLMVGADPELPRVRCIADKGTG